VKGGSRHGKIGKKSHGHHLLEPALGLDFGCASHGRIKGRRRRKATIPHRWGQVADKSDLPDCRKHIAQTSLKRPNIYLVDQYIEADNQIALEPDWLRGHIEGRELQ
jgi:hypothetical protein